MLNVSSSLFKKFLLGIMGPMILFALIFSSVIYYFSSQLIDDYVIPSFEDALTVNMSLMNDSIDSQLVQAAHEGDTNALAELQNELNRFQESSGVANAYVLGQSGNEEYIIALSQYDETMEAYTFSGDMRTAMGGTDAISEIYEDEFGTFKSYFSPVEGTEAIFGLDRDASFVSAASTRGIIISLILAGGMIIASIVISIIITRKISQPVTTLARHAEKVAQGNLNIEDIQVTSKDELGQLSEHFNKMVRDLRMMISQVGDKATQVAATSEELSASSEQTSESVSHVSETIQMIASSSGDQQERMEGLNDYCKALSIEMGEVANEAATTAQMSEETAHAAKEGATSIDQAITHMTAINEHVSQSADVVSKLQEESRAIGEIVTIITSIADQTNLLALNASIEAARAGENGKGFAVVADEVRKLAEESGTAANQIKEKIEQVQNQAIASVETMTEGYQAVKEGTEAVNQANASFERIEKTAIDSSNRVNSIKEALAMMDEAISVNVKTISELTEISNDVSSSIQSVSATSEEQTAIMEEVASASESLSKMAEQLQHSVQKFNTENNS
ncbi:HAMP domain-containing protein [Salipaludibacillus agaradhaerens]|uniref:methyl-accepting chemotaxis protein n=1 Tax=Salipaludibacillus agaradhaerens TaxID=76935 RepID=UPI002150F768|nr:HAMP domain-containing methyl-accepting chemotaxis protein [Salipaludibacillus agaradhaerens]MCR6108325.1 HAMP domain-containing protein [Salipaludibacillus agaradhaerens]MCR6120350.1 HAMP domain-containing protein [Salipaludibacillus agaradhaerens]